jgi:hypothetical protein
MSVTRICDFCSRGQPEVWRWTMTRKERDPDGAKHSISRGGLDMCRPDWERIAKPRMKSETLDWMSPGEGICDRCRSTDEVIRYTLKKSVRDGGVVRDIAGGGINLCHECWQTTAKPRMRALNTAREKRALVERSLLTSGGVPRALPAGRA